MQILWKLGSASAGELLSVWPGVFPETRVPALSTVSTVLSRLEQRGVLRSERQGRERVFTPLVKQTDVRRNMVSQLVSTLFGGDSQALLAHLVRESDVALEDIETARRMLQDSEADDESTSQDEAQQS